MRDFLAACKRILKTGKSHHHWNHFDHHDGMCTWFSYEMLPLRDKSEIIGIILITNDVTEVMRNQRELETHIKLLENITEGVCVFNAKGVHIWCNQKFCDLENRQGSLENHCFFKVATGESKELDFDRMIEKVDREGYWENMIYRNRNLEDQRIERMKVVKFVSPGSDEQRYLAITVDETQASAFKDAYENQKHLDALTGTINRQYFNEVLYDLIENNQFFSLFHVDIDSFSTINRLKGFDYGDRLLVHLCDEIKKAFQGCILSRSHGDNFLVIKRNKHPDDFKKVVKRLKDEIGRKLSFEGLEYSISIGAMNSSEVATSYKDAFLFAETAKKMAKKERMNSVVVYSNQMEEQHIVVYVEHYFSSGLDLDDFSLHYQPIYASGSLEVEGLEVLLRWYSKEHGNISPATFIPIAEKQGVISDISYWVIESSLELLENHATFFKNKYLSINISVLDFMNEAFMAKVMELFQHNQHLARKIELEITETYYFEQVDLLSERVNDLRALGIKLAIDDFGTGFSTLEKIAKISFDRIKIDKSFVDGVNYRPQNAIILQMISVLSKDLKLFVTVEGVETEAQVEFLRTYDFDAFQGFYFSRPKSFREILEES